LKVVPMFSVSFGHGMVAQDRGSATANGLSLGFQLGLSLSSHIVELVGHCNTLGIRFNFGE